MATQSQAFVKFFGQACNRSARERPVADAVRTSGSHRICTYPGGGVRGRCGMGT